MASWVCLMNRRDLLAGSAALSAFAFLQACSKSDMTDTASTPATPAGPPPTPPVAKREPHRITQLGHTRTDDYHWMKDDNWQNVMRDPSVLKPEIKAHLDAENAYREAMMQPTTALQDKLYQEMRGRTKEDDSSVPTPDGPWDYYRRYNTGAQYPLYVRKAARSAGTGDDPARRADFGSGQGLLQSARGRTFARSQPARLHRR